MTDIKYDEELGYWSKRQEIEGKLVNKHYEELMLSLSGKPKEWFSGKVVGDFGCGPRGSLEWLDNARERYCIDVLVDESEVRHCRAPGNIYQVHRVRYSIA